MRERYPFNLPAGGRWPDANQQQQGQVPRFNWCKIDNRGTNAVTVGLGGHPAAGDAADSYMDVQAGTVRVFNVAGPVDAADTGDAFLEELHLISALGTFGLIEVSDHPIVDLPNFSTLQTGALPVTDISVFFTETTAPLAASATFTGPWHDAQLYNWFGAVALTDAAGGTLIVDEADAATPNVTNLVASQAVAATNANAPTPPAAGQQARIVPTKTIMRFVRVRFVNGATVQTRLNIQSALSPLN